MTDRADSGDRVLASGRASEVVLLEDGHVLRRVHGRGCHEREAAIMRHARAAGYPVPEVVGVRPDGLVMERIVGPTMWDALRENPSQADRYARTLAELHRRLHRIAPPPEAIARYGEPRPDDVLLHGDLHPMNVMLSAGGPVVVDWTNAGRGAAAIDVADLWLVLGAIVPSMVGASGEVQDLVRRFLASFLAAANREAAARYLHVAAAWRLKDPHLSGRERESIRMLADRHGVT